MRWARCAPTSPSSTTISTIGGGSRAGLGKDAQQILEDQLDHELLDRTRREAEEKLAGVRTEIVKLNEALRTAAADLDLDSLPPEIPELTRLEVKASLCSPPPDPGPSKPAR